MVLDWEKLCASYTWAMNQCRIRAFVKVSVFFLWRIFLGRVSWKNDFWFWCAFVCLFQLNFSPFIFPPSFFLCEKMNEFELTQETIFKMYTFRIRFNNKKYYLIRDLHSYIFHDLSYHYNLLVFGISCRRHLLKAMVLIQKIKLYSVFARGMLVVIRWGLSN